MVWNAYAAFVYGFICPIDLVQKTIAAVPTSKVLMGVQGQDWEVFAVEPGICG